MALTRENPPHTETIYSIRVTEEEVLIWQFAERFELCPKLSIEKRDFPGMDWKYAIGVERYPKTFNELDKITAMKYIVNLEVLINLMHALGLFHGDLHLKNVVVDENRGFVRLIDFENTKTITSSFFFKDMYTFIGKTVYGHIITKSTTKEDLCQLEVDYFNNEYKRFINKF